MEKSFKLRAAIEREMSRQGYNFSTFSDKSGINRGVFSAILNSTPPKPISFHQLKTITEALGKPADWLFDDYVGECFYDGRPNRRRIEPFLLACAELGRYDLLREVLNRLLEDLKYLPFVFDTGESLFMAGKFKASAPFYKNVIDHEKHQHAERLSISQYRLFRTRLGEDGEENLKAAVQFECFRSALPERLRLDALLRLGNIYYELGKFAEMEKMADELYETARNVYDEERKGAPAAPAENEPRPLPVKPLVFYYGSALLHKQLALIEQERYEEAKPYSAMYGDLSGFEGLDDEGRTEVELFKVFAHGNGMDLELLTGNFSVLPEYAAYMDSHPHEVVLCLVILVEAANKYDADVDDLLGRYFEPIERYLEQRPDSYYPEAVTRSTFASLHYQLAVYEQRRGRRDQSSRHVRECWKLSQELNNQQHFRQLASLLSMPPMLGAETPTNEAEPDEAADD
ncbi:hypothetical protein QWJ34_10230 [Saccharibacillus sp. CPCC 101409]|uniref:hypothetical protein n=1 Tax=Saccharibacillus sp. CPCC 101409 TaxID=3058041 RepID=UPI002673DB4B|nr:hypothetical protein [Saccharibacillus sp. CPCC 101409]MDO3410138.1 hypothetical protein [Saccharibacillus sp. CPCC 101409]